MTKKHKREFYKYLLFAAIALLLFLTSGRGRETVGIHNSEETAVPAAGSELRVDFIDVGQGDSTLVEKDGHFMLIDAGEREQGDTVVSYLKTRGVKKLDYVIGTHPHADHIGGLEKVIKTFDIGKVVLPEKEHTIITYERLLTAIEDKNLKVTLPHVGDTYQLGGASFLILAPNGDYGDNLNNWSVGIRITYGENSFVLCGDAEKAAEADIVAGGLPLKADVLKLSHHGSSTSSSAPFMDRVDPDYAVISCGKNNDYGHPHKEILEMLKEKNIKALRTDQLGTIVALSDGVKVTFPGLEGEIGSTAVSPETVPGSEVKDYVINTNTKKFHLPGCKSAVSMKQRNRKEYTGTRNELLEKGYEPCRICNP